ncbi:MULTISPECIES: PrsW family intramembrane metalloprotease [Butyrivibrio]|uniref:PrsW family intramembrane metalloprotease n=1 Tax=Butyrivibrio TaxID=830 RepID=UPI0004175ED2|nr:MULTISPECIES: PrsW family glutamic-type intramembrane protease [Butyrivibrio]
MDIVLAILAVLPAAVLLCIIYKADKVEKEPLGLMAAVFFFGALTTVSAVALEYFGILVLDMVFPKQNVVYHLIENFLVIGVAEEAGKYFVLKKCTWNNEEFNFAFDGIVYSVCASLGFATIENVMYVFQFGFMTGLMRAVLSVPGHCIFGVFMGAYYGLAKGYECRGRFDKRNANTQKAFWIPVGLHGLYDFCLSTEHTLTMLVFIGLELFMVIKAILYVKRISTKDLPLRPGMMPGQMMNGGYFGMNPMQGQFYPMRQPVANGQFMQPQFYQGQQMAGNRQFMQGQGQFYQGQVVNGQPMQPQFYREQQSVRNIQPINARPVQEEEVQPSEDFKVIQSYVGYENGPATEKLSDGICDGLTNPTPVFSVSDFD